MPQRVVEHAPGHLGIPVVEATKHHQDRRHAHHHVEMRDNEIGVGERNVHADIAEEQAGQPTNHEGADEGNREEHRHGEMDIATPQRDDPVVDFDGRWHRDDQRCRGEEEAEIRIHAADKHMVRPHHHGEQPDGEDGPHHRAVAEDALARVHADEVRDDAERRQRHDIDLRMPEEPEQVLEQQRAATLIVELLAHRHHRRHEEARAERLVEQHHHARDE
ncbi:hypothetical protein D3C72_1377870 [compost metagenome]